MIYERYVVIGNIFKQFITPSLSLFTSLSTLICCALPTLLVAIGMGASMVSLISLFPWLIILNTRSKSFFIAGLLLLISFYLFWRRKCAVPNRSNSSKNVCKIKIHKFNYSYYFFNYFSNRFFLCIICNIFH